MKCSTCPFENFEYGSESWNGKVSAFYCDAPGIDHKEVFVPRYSDSNISTPEWCPLPITIS